MKKLVQVESVQWLEMQTLNGRVIGSASSVNKTFFDFLILFSENEYSYRLGKVRLGFLFFLIYPK